MQLEWLWQVKRIDYYQRTDQALSQFLSGASVQSLSSDVTTYLHGDGLLTLRVARLPEGQELPGADADQIWFWLRPRQVCVCVCLRKGPYLPVVTLLSLPRYRAGFMYNALLKAYDFAHFSVLLQAFSCNRTAT